MRGRDLYQFKAFCAIVEHESFVRAASHLGLPASGLSQTLKELEERLNTRLLNRTTRSVSLTDAGRKLFEHVAPALAVLESAEAEVATFDGRVSGNVRLNASRIAATVYLAPLLSRFLADYPEVHVDIVVDDRLTNVIDHGFDGGVRLGEKLHQDMIAVPLGGDLQMKAVASPGYLQRYGVPTHPQELMRHKCLCFRNPTATSVYRWEFVKGAERMEVMVTGPITVDEPAMLPGIAASGAGIAYQFSHQVDSMLATGELVQVLSDWTPPFPGFFIYYPSRRHLPPAFRAFIDYVKMTGQDR